MTCICSIGAGAPKLKLFFEWGIQFDQDNPYTVPEHSKTYLHEDYSSMLAYDDYYHCSYVSYQGSSSKTYKAYVCIWAGKNGSGYTRYMWATE